MRQRLIPAAILTLLLTLGLSPAPAAAQQTPTQPNRPCIENCGGGGGNNPPLVDVTPYGTSVTTQTLAVKIYWCDDGTLNGGTRWVHENGTDRTSSYSYETASGFSELCAGKAVEMMSQGTLSFPHFGGSITLSGHICDYYSACTTNSRTYTYTPPAQLPPVVTLYDFPAEKNVDRSLCLVSGAGEASAFECGDLLSTHAMPAYRTKGRDHALTLLYSSAQAAPTAVVAAHVQLPSGSELPNSVVGDLRVKSGGAVVAEASASYSVSSWTAGATREIALAVPVAGLTTGAYPFDLIVSSVYADSAPETTVSDTLLVVSRSSSRLGQGWSLAGVERLHKNQPAGGHGILWVGGDGSARYYDSLTSSSWLAPKGAHRDTIALSGGVYRRTLRHGIRVEYNLDGYQIRTISRAGDTTRFYWSGSASPLHLDSIHVPPSGVSGTTYRLAYDASGKLDSVTDPAGRALNVTVSGGRLTSLTDPDGYSVGYEYRSDGRMSARTGRRGYRTTFEYAHNLRLTRVHIPLSAAETATTSFTPWDQKGLAWDGDTAVAAIAPSGVATKIWGPRAGVADDAVFSIDRWGAPTKITDPLGHITRITRDAASATPALPTRVTYPDGEIVQMSWNPRGNLTESRDSTAQLAYGQPTRVTGYQYNDPNAPDSPSQITDPTGVATTFHYNALGLTDTVTAPNGHKTAYQYGSGNQRGLVRAITELAVSTYDSVAYTKSPQPLRYGFAFDARGNVASDTSPMGHVTTFSRDGTERVTGVFDPLGHQTGYSYDEMNRLTAKIKHIEGGRLLSTRTYYTAGMVDSIVDPRGVTRRYQYDEARRQIAMIDEVGAEEDRTYDRAGNLVTLKTRRLQGTSDAIVSTYDPAGRLIQKVWPTIRDSLSPDPGGDSIPGDTLALDYDTRDRLTSARTGEYRVTRSYYGNGLLRQELQSRVDGSDQFTHMYGYDMAGRRTWYRIGGAGSAGDSIWYHYDSSTGNLRTIGVRWRQSPGVSDSVRFFWDALGRRDSLLYSARSAQTTTGGNGAQPIAVSFAYDRDGHVRRICARHGGDPSLGSQDPFKLRYAWQDIDAAGRVLHLVHAAGSIFGDTQCPNSTGQDDWKSVYDYRNQLTMQVHGDSTLYDYDDSGNMTQYTTMLYTGDTVKSRQFVHASGTNRIVEFGRRGALYAWVLNNADGSRIREFPVGTMNDVGFRYYWYDALDRFTGAEQYYCAGYVLPSLSCNAQPYAYPNNCKYDPLDRLISPCGDPDVGGLEFGYDGQNVVRTRPDGQDYSWTFVHGPGTDDPLMGHYWASNGTNKYMYFVTDGNGRQLAVGEATGRDLSSDQSSTFQPRKYAGGVTNGFGFGASRRESKSAQALSFFRNRVYDQESGRWLQEDPMGVAAGSNLFRYANNNPVSLTDPFGLKVCFRGTPEQIQQLRHATEDATATTITLDKNNCVSKFEPTGEKGFEKLQARFGAEVDSKITFGVQFSDEGAYSHFDEGENQADINPGDIGTPYFTSAFLTGCVIPENRGRFTAGALVAHELIGHGAGVILSDSGRPFNQGAAIRMENIYHANRGEPKRCGG